MSNKKILPVSYPMITSWQWHATLFSIIGDDERAKAIDKVSKPERCASRKAGGTGYRYTCQVGGKICHLTYEENYRWFMERK